MADVRTIRSMCGDLRDVADAIERRATAASQAATGVNRQANRLGTNITGGRGEGDQYSNPTKDTALNLVATQEQVQSDLQQAREFLYRTAGLLAEFAKPRTWDDGVRRCGEVDCARGHHAQGLCETHYRKQLRAQERRDAKEARDRQAS